MDMPKRDARAMPPGMPNVPDLSARKPVPITDQEDIKSVLQNFGVLCLGCGRSMRQGWEFLQYEAFTHPQAGIMSNKVTMRTCARTDCDAAARAAKNAQAMRRFTDGWVLLTEDNLLDVLAKLGAEEAEGVSADG